MRLFLFALCLTFAAAVSAQDRGGGPPPEKPKELTPEQLIDSLTEGLKLDAKQSEKVKALSKDYFDRTKGKGEEAKVLREKLMALEKDLSEQTRRLEEAIRDELTLEQKDRFDMLRVHRRNAGRGGPRERREIRIERRGGPGGRPGPGGPPGMDDMGPGRFPPEMWEERRGGPGGPGQGHGGPGAAGPGEPEGDEDD